MIIYQAYAFIFGICIGSFLNVCIYRIPESTFFSNKRSKCPNCEYQIKFYDNIPLVSYLLLWGKCRKCKWHIPIRYPLVELITGLSALSVFNKFCINYQDLITLPGIITGLVYFTFIAALIIITFIDIDHQIIPDVISLPGIPLCFMATFAIRETSFIDSIMGILAGGGSLLLIAWGYEQIRKKQGMGGGDIKLLAMIGALLGWKGVLFTIYLSSAVGTLAGVAIMLRKKKDMKLAIPFGPFLSIGAIVYIFFGKELTRLYFELLR
jgi:leader peptidase (prepilin peptidase)/N-methyltransferase